MQIHLPTLSILVCLVACGPVSADKPTDSGDDGPSCGVTVRSTSPANNAPDHYHRSPIVFQFSAPDDTAVVVTDVAGESTWSEDGKTLTFTPDDPLEPDSTYTIGLDYCHGRPEISFSTSELGLPVQSDLDLEGLAYTLDFRSGEYVLGENAGELLNAIFTRDLLFELLSLEADELVARAAISKKDVSPPVQDMCSRTLDLEGLDISETPYFESRFDDLWFGANGGMLRFASFDVSGTISPDGQSIGGMDYTAVMGMSQVADLLPDWGEIDTMCDIAENLGIPCEPCPDDEDALCVTVSARKMSASTVDIHLEQVNESASPGCED